MRCSSTNPRISRSLQKGWIQGKELCKKQKDVLYQITDYLRQNGLKDKDLNFSQNQPSRGVLMKGCSQNIQQIYSRTAMPKRDFDQVEEKLY